MLTSLSKIKAASMLQVSKGKQASSSRGPVALWTLHMQMETEGCAHRALDLVALQICRLKVAHQTLAGCIKLALREPMQACTGNLDQNSLQPFICSHIIMQQLEQAGLLDKSAQSMQQPLGRLWCRRKKEAPAKGMGSKASSMLRHRRSAGRESLARTMCKRTSQVELNPVYVDPCIPHRDSGSITHVQDNRCWSTRSRELGHDQEILIAILIPLQVPLGRLSLRAPLTLYDRV